MTTKAIYVAGAEGLMRVWERPPGKSSYFSQNLQKEITHYGWPGSGCQFHAKRGVLAEWRGQTVGHVYCRRVPAKMVEEIQTVDASIKELEEALAKLRAERQLVLKAAAVRGARVKVADCWVWDASRREFVPPT